MSYFQNPLFLFLAFFTVLGWGTVIIERMSLAEVTHLGQKYKIVSEEELWFHNYHENQQMKFAFSGTILVNVGPPYNCMRWSHQKNSFRIQITEKSNNRLQYRLSSKGLGPAIATGRFSSSRSPDCN